MLEIQNYYVCHPRRLDLLRNANARIENAIMFNHPVRGGSIYHCLIEQIRLSVYQINMGPDIQSIPMSRPQTYLYVTSEK
jgi:hypothetical protein